MDDAYAHSFGGIMVPEGGFRCILADPPWAFRTFSGNNATPHRSAEDHYTTLSAIELEALPVASIAAKDCALFMWVVGSHLDEALDLGKAWGFAFKTDAFYWMKQKLITGRQMSLFTGDVPEPGIGMGYWTRKQVEPCWLFTRGKPKRLSMGVRQVILEPRREHSRKPDEQYPRIEALCDGPRLELFARTHRAGWTAWGNQTEKLAETAE